MTEKKKYGIGGKLNIIEGLEELRERLKKLGGKEVLSDEEWKAGGISVEGHIRTSEPFVDVFYKREDGEYVKVIVEMPGVEEKDIKVSVEGKKLTISAETLRRKYHKDIELDYPIEGEFQTSYRNGILELTLTKKEA